MPPPKVKWKNLTPQQREALVTSFINRTIGGMSPARDVWSQAKKRSKIDAQTLKYVFNLNLAHEADALYRLCRNLEAFQVEGGPLTDREKARVQKHLVRVLG